MRPDVLHTQVLLSALTQQWRNGVGGVGAVAADTIDALLWTDRTEAHDVVGSVC